MDERATSNLYSIFNYDYDHGFECVLHLDILDAFLDRDFLDIEIGLIL